MKKHNHIRTLVAVAFPVLATLAGCTSDNELPAEMEIGKKSVTITALQGDGMTRLVYTDANSTGINTEIGIGWKASDAINVYKVAGAGVGYTFIAPANITGGTTSSTSFSGDVPAGWLAYEESNVDWKAFYPASKAAVMWADCEFSMLGQVQNGSNANATDHLSHYSYMTATASTIVLPGSFTFRHETSILKFVIELPAAITPRSMTLSTQDEAGIVVAQKTNGTKQYAKQLSMAFTNITSSTFTAYMAVLPSILTEKLALAVVGSNNMVYNYTVSITTGEQVKYETGKVYDASLAYGGTSGQYGEADVYDQTLAEKDMNTMDAEAGGTYTLTLQNGSGTNSETNPYLIQSARDLHHMKVKVNLRDPVYGAACYKLTTDIQVTATLWEPIGIGSGQDFFRGCFDGGGHTVSGELKTTLDCKKWGIFGLTNGATIRNLHIAADVNYTLAQTTKSAVYSIGTLIGHAEKTKVYNCSASGNIIVNTPSTAESTFYIGKMIGNTESSVSTNMGEIKNCQATGDLDIDFSIAHRCYVGGIVGNNASLITQCVNSGTIEHNQKGRLGGISGYNFGSIKFCFNNGKLVGRDMVGGIAGVNMAPIHTSRNLSVDIVGSATMTGLLVGWNAGSTIFDCCTSVPVNGLPLIGDGSLSGCSNPTVDHATE